MGGREDLDRALKAIMADRREELGGPPSPEELLAYRDGELGPAERESVEARLAVYPEAARALAALAAFPDLDEAGTPELPAEEMDGRWQSFRQGLEKLPEAGPHPPAPSPAPPGHTLPGRGGADFRARERLSSRRSWPLQLAAAVLLSLGVGFFAGRAFRPPGAAVNVTIAELSPVEEEGTRSVSQVEFPDASEELVLVLGLPGDREFPDYRAEILGSEGARLWSGEGLKPSELGTFHLAFRRDVLPPGTYQLQLFGREGERETLLATYELRLAGG